jgi:hypothetical protein
MLAESTNASCLAAMDRAGELPEVIFGSPHPLSSTCTGVEGERELLELAAKAAQLPECGWMGPAFMYVKDNQFTDWNPLTDDGDALRLAVQLGLKVPTKHDDWIVKDPYAATRRAIVRAAARLAALTKNSEATP